MGLGDTRAIKVSRNQWLRMGRARVASGGFPGCSIAGACRGGDRVGSMVGRTHGCPRCGLEAVIIARMPARIAGGKFGQAATTAARSDSTAASGFAFAVATLASTLGVDWPSSETP